MVSVSGRKMPKLGERGGLLEVSVIHLRNRECVVMDPKLLSFAHAIFDPSAFGSSAGYEKLHSVASVGSKFDIAVSARNVN